MYHLHSGFLKKLFAQAIWITICNVNGFDFGIDDHAGADAAGLVGAIQSGAADACAIYRRLDDGILFGMHAAAKLVFFPGGHLELLAQAAGLFAVQGVFWAAIVSGGNQLIVFYQSGAYFAAQAGAALGCEYRHLHEIFLPAGAFHFCTSFVWCF